MKRSLLRGLRANGVDVRSTAEEDRLGASDEDQLTWAETHDRVIYTSDIADYARLHTKWFGAGDHHRGIIVLSDQLLSVGQQLKALLALTKALSYEDIRDQLVFLRDGV